MRKTTKYLGLIAIMILLAACWKSMSPEELEAEERLKIQTFQSQNDSLTFVSTQSGLYYHEVKAGTGFKPVANDSVYVFYTMKFINGSFLESNVGSRDTLIFSVGKDHVLAGFDEGVTYMKEGGETLFLIPSSLAYGPGGSYGIAGYTPLLINVNLVRVKKAAK